MMPTKGQVSVSYWNQFESIRIEWTFIRLQLLISKKMSDIVLCLNVDMNMSFLISLDS